MKQLKCQCENIQHFQNNEHGCNKNATRKVYTTYGIFNMCKHCADELPVKYKKFQELIKP